MIRNIGIYFLMAIGLLTGCGNPDGENRPCLQGPGQCSVFGADGQLPTENLGTDTVNDANGENFVCIATPHKSTLNHQEVLSLQVEVRGGLPPYNVYDKLDYPIESFNSRTTLLGYYNNETSSSKVVQRTVYIEDSANQQTHCNFTVTVRPAFSDSDLACTITPDEQVVAAGTPITFTMEGTGGTEAQYTFSSFSPKSGWTLADSYITRESDTQATARVIYQSQAVRYPEVIVENGGETASCRTAVFVGTTTPPNYNPGWDWTFFPPWWGWGGVPYLPPAPPTYIPPLPPAPPLACSLTAGPNPGLVGTLTEIEAHVPHYLGSGNYSIIDYSIRDAATNVNHLVDHLSAHSSAMRKVVRYRRPGQTVIRATVQDNYTGQIGYCQTFFHAKAATSYQVGTGKYYTPGQVRTYVGNSAVATHSKTLFNGDWSRETHVAQADVTGDGVVDILIARGRKNNLNQTDYRVVVLDGTNHAEVFNFNPLPSHGGDAGAWIGSGDINGDGHADIVVGQDKVASNGSWVKIYDGSSTHGTTPTLLRGFRPYGSSYTGGVRVAVGDVNGDGYSDVVTIPGYGRDKDIKVYSGLALKNNSLSILATFNPFPDGAGDFYGFESPAFVAVGDVDGDGLADIVAALGKREVASDPYTQDIYVYDGGTVISGTPTLLAVIDSPHNQHMGTSGDFNGNSLAVGDVDGDGYGEIITGDSWSLHAEVHIFNVNGSHVVCHRPFTHYPYGVFVGGGTGGL